MADERTVPVWLHGERVGEVSRRRREQVRFRYDDSVVEAHDLNTPILSCSLRTSRRRVDGRPFFAGLLPEGEARRALAAEAKLVVSDVIGLLTRFGQDVAGAVVIGHEVSRRPRAHAVTYTSPDWESEVEALADRSGPLAIHDDSELSIAGVQDKMLLVATPEGWARPVHGYPSTHILKIDDRRHPGLVIAEHTCLRLAGAAGLPAAASQLVRVADVDAIIVERFDREIGPDGSPVRVHDEDACQALGVDLEINPRAKYESDGGPRLAQVASLLRTWGTEEDLYCLLDQVVFTVASGNADAHGKNISLLHREPGRVALSPMYDTVPTVLWPSLRARAAMSIGGAIDLPDIDVNDILREAAAWHLPQGPARARILETLESLRQAAEGADVEDHEKAAATRDFILGRVHRLLESEVRGG